MTRFCYAVLTHKVSADQAPNTSPDISGNIGTIEVVVLRCKEAAQQDQVQPESQSKTISNKQAKANNKQESTRSAPQKGTFNATSAAGSLAALFDGSADDGFHDQHRYRGDLDGNPRRYEEPYFLKQLPESDPPYPKPDPLLTTVAPAQDRGAGIVINQFGGVSEAGPDRNYGGNSGAYGRERSHVSFQADRDSRSVSRTRSETRHYPRYSGRERRDRNPVKDSRTHGPWPPYAGNAHPDFRHGNLHDGRRTPDYSSERGGGSHVRSSSNPQAQFWGPTNDPNSRFAFGDHEREEVWGPPQQPYHESDGFAHANTHGWNRHGPSGMPSGDQRRWITASSARAPPDHGDHHYKGMTAGSVQHGEQRRGRPTDRHDPLPKQYGGSAGQEDDHRGHKQEHRTDEHNLPKDANSWRAGERPTSDSRDKTNQNGPSNNVNDTGNHGSRHSRYDKHDGHHEKSANQGPWKSNNQRGWIDENQRQWNNSDQHSNRGGWNDGDQGIRHNSNQRGWNNGDQGSRKNSNQGAWNYGDRGQLHPDSPGGWNNGGREAWNDRDRGGWSNADRGRLNHGTQGGSNNGSQRGWDSRGAAPGNRGSQGEWRNGLFGQGNSGNPEGWNNNKRGEGDRCCACGKPNDDKGKNDSQWNDKSKGGSRRSSTQDSRRSSEPQSPRSQMTRQSQRTQKTSKTHESQGTQKTSKSHKTSGSQKSKNNGQWNSSNNNQWDNNNHDQNNNNGQWGNIGNHNHADGQNGANSGQWDNGGNQTHTDGQWGGHNNQGESGKAGATTGAPPVQIASPPVLQIKPYWATWKQTGKPESPDTNSAKKRSRAEKIYVAPSEPLHAIPQKTAQEKQADHQVKAGRGAAYYHRVGKPEYLDSMEKPYAVFTFKYRSKGKSAHGSCSTVSDV